MTHSKMKIKIQISFLQYEPSSYIDGAALSGGPSCDFPKLAGVVDLLSGEIFWLPLGSLKTEGVSLTASSGDLSPPVLDFKSLDSPFFADIAGDI